jgi:hypothetical protein
VRELESEWPNIVRPVWQELDETLQLRLSRTLKDGLAVSHTPRQLATRASAANDTANAAQMCVRSCSTTSRGTAQQEQQQQQQQQQQPARSHAPLGLSLPA